MVMNLIGATAGALAGGGINDIFDKASADRSYDMNRRLQEHDQAFQKEMRATAYQTMVQDMEKAGINPAVALSNGGGTVMGGSSSASASAPKTSAMDMATAAVGLKQGKAAVDQTYANIDNQTALTNADVELKKAQAIKAMKEAGWTDAQINHYMTHGVPIGATITTGHNFGGFGISGGTQITRPITAKNENGMNWKEYAYRMELAEKYVKEHKLTWIGYQAMEPEERKKLPWGVPEILREKQYKK